MTSHLYKVGPLTSAAADLADSLDVRLMLAGRLSLDVVQLRRDRTELAAVLGRTDRARTSPAIDRERNAR